MVACPRLLTHDHNIATAQQQCSGLDVPAAVGTALGPNRTFGQTAAVGCVALQTVNQTNVAHASMCADCLMHADASPYGLHLRARPVSSWIPSACTSGS
jgi:hypothetical protein